MGSCLLYILSLLWTRYVRYFVAIWCIAFIEFMIVFGGMCRLPSTLGIPISECYYLKICNAITIYQERNISPSKIICVL